jgi:hypothetical protein
MKSTPRFGASAPLLLFAGIVCRSRAARAAVTWRADFETGNLSQFSGNVNATNGARKNIEIVADPVQQGQSAGKFTIHADDTFAATQMRVQVTRNGSPTGEGQDVLMSWYFLIAADPMIRDNIAYWETSGSNRNMMTWWIAPKAGGGTTFDFGTGSLGSTKHIFTLPIALNQWHQVASHIHWSMNAQQGHIIVWLDGAKVADENALTKPDMNSLFFQAGIHRANRSPLVDTVFFDNFLEGDSLADIMVADPGAPDAGSNADARADGLTDDAAAVEGGAAGGSAGGAGGTGGVGTTGGNSGSGGTGAGTGGTPGTGGGSGGTTQVVDAGRDTQNTAADEISGCALSPAARTVTFARVGFTSMLGWLLLLGRRRRSRRPSRRWS